MSTKHSTTLDSLYKKQLNAFDLKKTNIDRMQEEYDQLIINSSIEIAIMKAPIVEIKFQKPRFVSSA